MTPPRLFSFDILQKTGNVPYPNLTQDDLELTEVIQVNVLDSLPFPLSKHIFQVEYCHREKEVPKQSNLLPSYGHWPCGRPDSEFFFRTGILLVNRTKPSLFRYCALPTQTLTRSKAPIDASQGPLFVLPSRDFFDISNRTRF